MAPRRIITSSHTPLNPAIIEEPHLEVTDRVSSEGRAALSEAYLHPTETRSDAARFYHSAAVETIQTNLRNANIANRTNNTTPAEFITSAAKDFNKLSHPSTDKNSVLPKTSTPNRKSRERDRSVRNRPETDPHRVQSLADNPPS